MQLTLWTGIFWLCMANIAGWTVVRTARALRRMPDPDPAEHAIGGRRAVELRELTQRVAALEAQVASQGEAIGARDAEVAALEARVDFTDRLLEGRRAAGGQLPGA